MTEERSPESKYREPFDSQLERDLLAYTLDTGSPLIRELRPLLFPIADNVLRTRSLFAEHERGCSEWRAGVSRKLDAIAELHQRVSALEDREEVTGVQERERLERKLLEAHDNAKRWKWWALGVGASILSAAASVLATLLVR